MNPRYRFGKRALVLDEHGSKIGEMSIFDAQKLAESQGLDLVEINRQGDLSICKIMDEGKWKYEQKKKSKANKQHVPSLKEMKFSMRIDPHDEAVKVDHCKQFLSKGDNVRIVLELRGREKGKRLLAEEKLNHILSMIGSECKIERQQGNSGDLIVFIRPGKKHEQTANSDRHSIR